MRYASETIERVKEAADIVELVSARTDLRRQGQRFGGLCPFHEERTPSFSVDPVQKLYHCFGCGVGGDVFKFVQETEGLDFPQALEALAERYGVEIAREREDPAAEQRRTRRKRLHELLERAAAFYGTYLWESPRAEAARGYLAGRGLGEEVLRGFEVGFAPSAWDSLLVRGQRAGFRPEELVASGLAQKGRSGGLYDRFRARIMFPVRDQRGRVVGFGARAMGEGKGPKYLNSPEGELYRKSETLFGVHRARPAIARAGQAILVEGYTDVLALHQAGFEEAVAVMGTAVTPQQIGILSGLTDKLILGLDADRAGREAMLRAQHVASSRKMGIQVLGMPADTDPCELLQQRPPETFRELVENALDLPEFQVNAVLEGVDPARPADRDRAIRELAPVIGGMSEPVARTELTRKVADALDLGEEPLRELMRDAGAPEGNGAERAAEPVPDTAPRALTSREQAERVLLGMCVAEPGRGREYLARLSPEHLSGPTAVRAVEWLEGNLDDPLSNLPRSDEELVGLVTQVVMSAEREPAFREAMESVYLKLEVQRVERRRAEVEKRVHADGLPEAERREAEELSARLSRERSEVLERIRRIEEVAEVEERA